MMKAHGIRVLGRVATLLAMLLLVLTACDSGPDEPPPAATAAQPPAAANDGQMASIDSEGKIAPFGFASRKPVPVPEPAAASVAAAATATSTATAAAATSVVFNTNCAACHAADAKGVEGLGLNLVDSQLVDSSSPEELVVFLKEGRPMDSPDSVTKVPMPSFAWMTDADLAEVSGYLKTL